MPCMKNWLMIRNALEQSRESATRYWGKHLTRQMGFIIAILVLTVALLISNHSLRGDVEVLTEAISQPEPSEQELGAENDELSRQLAELIKELNRLKARDESLERLVVSHTAKFTELVNQIQTHEAKAHGAVSQAVTTEAETGADTTTAQSAESPRGTKHVLKHGETLQQLAGEYYNDPTEWRRILEANRGVVKDTRSMLPGITLLIPDAE